MLFLDYLSFFLAMVLVMAMKWRWSLATPPFKAASNHSL